MAVMESQAERTYGVAELGTELARLLAGAFPAEVWVHGQIRNLNRSAAGHVFFDLVEPCPLGAKPAAMVPVTLFDSDRRFVNAAIKQASRQRAADAMRMDDGVELRLRGRPQWYAPSGKLTLRMTGVDPTYTLGRLTEDRDRLLAVLAKEDLLGRNASLLMPPVPLRVGLVASDGSAAHADFMQGLAVSGLAWRVTLVDTRTQGLAAETSLVAALRTLARRGVNVVAVVRGGGARTDLAVFDREALCRTIAELAVPVLTGIGHETDGSVADRVAHHASKTPSACATYLVERVEQFLIDAEGAYAAVAARAERRLDEAELDLSHTARHVSRGTQGALAVGDAACRDAIRRVIRCSIGAVARADAQAERWRTAVVASGPRRLADASSRCDAAELHVRALDPERTLARGWSITRRADGTVVRRAAGVDDGEYLVTTVAEGTITSTVSATGAPATSAADRDTTAAAANG